MRNALNLRRLFSLVLVALVASGCVTYRLQDKVEVRDRVVDDSRALSVEIAAVRPPNVVLRLQLDGSKEIERTTITDRQVSYEVESSTLGGIEEFGMSPPIIFALTFGVVADVAQLAVSGPIVLVVGWLDSMDPATTTETVVEQQGLQLRRFQDVLVRFGPRQLQQVRHEKDNLIVVNGREAARSALQQGRSQVTAQVRLEDTDLRATFVMNGEVLRKLAGSQGAKR